MRSAQKGSVAPARICVCSHVICFDALHTLPPDPSPQPCHILWLCCSVVTVRSPGFRA